MAQKLKETADDGKIAQYVMNSAHQIWLAGLGAFAKAQAEGTKLFESLVKEGEAVQARAGKAANAQFAQMSKSASGAWDKLEQVFEERVSRSLNRLGVPTYNDIQALTKHVNELNASVQQLLAASQGAGQGPRRRTAKAAKPEASRAV
ncbi:MAG TPA: phasin family protein [Burkholderiales bacterium]|nr:phasin family protein [Burkholderiales bacterium]